ncbi:reverse transcriptase domain-containing protein [Tanacetum coccineum]
MSPPDHKKFCWGTVHATGRKGFTEPETGIWLKRINRRVRIPIDLYPKDPTRRSEPNNNENPDIAAIIAQQLQTILPQIVTQVANQVNANGGNGRNGGNGGNNGCSYKGFMACNPKEYDGKGGAIALTRWIEKMENMIDNIQARGREAAIGMSWTDFKALLVEEFCPSNEMEKLETWFRNHKMVGANHAGYTDRFHKLAKLALHLVTPESSRIKRYIDGLALEIRGMLRATQPTTIHSAILRARILIDEAVSCGTLTKGNEKRKEWKRQDCRTPYRQVAPVNAVRMGNNHRVCYECGSSNHLRNTCPNMNRAPSQAGNPLALEGNRNT